MEKRGQEKKENRLKGQTDTQIRIGLRGLATDAMRRPNKTGTYEETLLEEAADRLQQFENLSSLLGLLAPAGTAPRTAIEQIYKQSAYNGDESQIVLDLRQMLSQHWGEWTPALREAEGLPPEITD